MTRARSSVPGPAHREGVGAHAAALPVGISCLSSPRRPRAAPLAPRRAAARTLPRKVRHPTAAGERRRSTPAARAEGERGYERCHCDAYVVSAAEPTGLLTQAPRHRAAASSPFSRGQWLQVGGLGRPQDALAAGGRSGVPSGLNASAHPSVSGEHADQPGEGLAPACGQERAGHVRLAGVEAHRGHSASYKELLVCRAVLADLCWGPGRGTQHFCCGGVLHKCVPSLHPVQAQSCNVFHSIQHVMCCQFDREAI